MQETLKKPSDLLGPIEIKIQLPQYMVDLLDWLGNFSRMTNEKIIVNFICDGLKSIRDNTLHFEQYAKDFFETIEGYLHDFEEYQETNK